MRRIQHFIDGQHTAGISGRVGDVYDPATGKVQAQVDLASGSEVDQAVASATKAAIGWSESSLTQRTQIMFRFRELLASAQMNSPKSSAANTEKLCQTQRAKLHAVWKMLNLPVG